MAGYRAVFLDVGETVFDRSREYVGWAHRYGVPAHTFSAVFGAVIAAGGGVIDVLRHFEPGIDFARARAELDAQGLLPALAEEDIYPGVRAALANLKSNGYFIGIAGNQPIALGDQVRALALPADWVATSSEIGFSKPDAAFFAALAERADCAAEQVVYVGDQLDNDVVAARRAGLACVRVLTGPWGQLVRDAEVEAECLAVLPSAAELPDVLGAGPGGRVGLDRSDRRSAS